MVVRKVRLSGIGRMIRPKHNREIRPNITFSNAEERSRAGVASNGGRGHKVQTIGLRSGLIV